MPPFSTTLRSTTVNKGARPESEHLDAAYDVQDGTRMGRDDRPVRVLVPVDVTRPSAEQALRTGAWFASVSGGELVALYVVAPTDIWDAPPADTFDQSAELLVERRREQLVSLVAALDLPVTPETVVEIAYRGDIAGTIALTATAREADVIVTASNRAFELRGALLGSVARRLVNLWPRPVLVVRAS